MADYSTYLASPYFPPIAPPSPSLRITKRSRAKAGAQSAFRAICKAAGSLFTSSEDKKRPTSTFVMPAEYAAAKRLTQIDAAPKRKASTHSVPKRTLGSRRGRQMGAITITRTSHTLQGKNENVTLLGPIHVPIINLPSPVAAPGIRSSLFIANPDPPRDPSMATLLEALGPSNRSSSEVSNRSWQTISTFTHDVPTTPTYWKRFPSHLGQDRSQKLAKGKSGLRSRGTLTKSRHGSKRVFRRVSEAVKARHIDNTLAALEGGIPAPAPAPLSIAEHSSATMKTTSTETVHTVHTGKPSHIKSLPFSSYPYALDPSTGKLNSIYVPYSPMFVPPRFAADPERPLPRGPPVQSAGSTTPDPTDSVRHRSHYTQIENYPFVILDSSVERVPRRSDEIVAALATQKVHVDSHALGSIDEDRAGLNEVVKRKPVPENAVDSADSDYILPATTYCPTAYTLPATTYRPTHRRTPAVSHAAHPKVLPAGYSPADVLDFPSRALPRIPTLIERRRIPKNAAPAPLKMLDSGYPDIRQAGIVELRPVGPAKLVQLSPFISSSPGGVKREREEDEAWIKIGARVLEPLKND